MKKFLCGTMTVLLLVATFAVAAPWVPRSAVLANQQDEKDKLREKLQRLRVRRILTGEDVVLRVKQLRKQNKAIARAMKEAEKQGLRPAFNQGSVIIATDPASITQPANVSRLSVPFMQPAFFRSPLLQGSETFTDGDYEVTFISYDDGNPSNWEGIVYRAGPDVADDTRYTTVYIGGNVPYPTYEVYYPEDGGDPQPMFYNSAKLSEPPASLAPKVPTACNMLGEQLAATQFMAVKMALWAKPSGQGGCPPPTRPCMRVPGECCAPPPNIRPWLRCSAATCTTAAVACRLSGPGWAHCFGAWCVGGMVGCLFYA